ncbi:MAG: type I 3-dehydroquinate dehydratase [Prevotellaceae bacterium]|jgi:3-dehydroquinate dehydratase type I|nr:type I 3-dehydroquinate dehydratase [Prevotellaceae bacterium]
MICTSIIERNIDKCIKILKQCEMAELRLDRIQPEPNAVKQLMSLKIPVIATCRAGIYNDDKRLELLTIAVQNGAAYIDIELESNEHYKKQLIDLARSCNCKIIISYHNYNETPDVCTLKSIVAQAGTFNPDFVKIATRALSIEDNYAILSLYETEKNLIAFTMGKLGKKSRIKSLQLGSPFIYASYTKKQQAAEGQFTMNELKKILER